MNVLVACEFSGIVRDAFIAKGHNAVSCDLMPTEREGPHVINDILKVLQYRRPKWDLLIAHPMCKYLTNAGSLHLYRGGKKCNGIDSARWVAMCEAVWFFNKLLNADIPKIAVENPIMHNHARVGLVQPYAQIVHPWQFGHAETKAPCLWLKGLPKLVPTDIVPPDFKKYPPGKGNGYKPVVHYESPGPDRMKNRSRTKTGLAAAMAAQWG